MHAALAPLRVINTPYKSVAACEVCTLPEMLLRWCAAALHVCGASSKRDAADRYPRHAHVLQVQLNVPPTVVLLPETTVEFKPSELLLLPLSTMVGIPPVDPTAADLEAVTKARRLAGRMAYICIKEEAGKRIIVQKQEQKQSESEEKKRNRQVP